jgi:hypothetical protein
LLRLAAWLVPPRVLETTAVITLFAPAAIVAPQAFHSKRVSFLHIAPRRGPPVLARTALPASA